MYSIVKRSIDFIFALIVLIILLPLFIPVMILLKFTGEGEIFYYQKRIGKNRKAFDILKFASMLKNSLNIGSKTVTLDGDPRITPVGKYLRKSKINELPQIINVLRGDMSVVGPRPLLPGSFAKYSDEVQEVLSKIIPGITGIGSIIFRNEAAIVQYATQDGWEALDFYRKHIYPYKGSVEVWYSENRSFYVDFMCIILTAWYIVKPKSDLVYHVFKSIPKKPLMLTLAHWENKKEDYV